MGGEGKDLAFFLALLVAALIGVLSAKPDHAATFTVNSIGDENNLDSPGGTFDGSSDGECDVNSSTTGDQCTLRAAIQEVNNNANTSTTVDLIKFAIPGAGPHTISPTSELPPITEAVTINGYSESLDGRKRPCVG